MKALVWHGKEDIRCDNVPDPTLEDPRDAIVKVTSCAICGSDLHLFHHFMPAMKKGDVMGHEFMGEVVAVGSAIRRLKVGDRMVVPFTINCGDCAQCRRGYFAACERTNRNKTLADTAGRRSTCGCRLPTPRTSGCRTRTSPTSSCSFLAISFRRAASIQWSTRPSKWPCSAPTGRTSSAK